jgi:hypothetical protein
MASGRAASEPIEITPVEIAFAFRPYLYQWGPLERCCNPTIISVVA